MESPEISEEQEQKTRIRQKRREYYDKNKYTLCNNTINVYCIAKIEKVRSLYMDRVGEYINRYSFEEYADSYIRKQLSIYKINKSHSHYDDCYDAGMMAYLYSVHRCAEMSYSHVEPYIKKLIRIYIICAIVIHNDSKNLCKENNFSEVRLDSEASSDKY
jgi:hypothetical protein